MPGSRSSNNESEHKSPRESGEDSEDESEILEESPCGRWLKRKEEVSSFIFFISKSMQGYNKFIYIFTVTLYCCTLSVNISLFNGTK